MDPDISIERSKDPNHAGTLRVVAGRIAAILVGIVAAIGVVTAVAPQSTGPIALIQILLPHLFLGTLVLALVLALGLKTRAVSVALVALIVVGLLRFGSEWISLPGPRPTGQSIAVMSWNLEWGARAATAAAGPILEHDADVVALQELTPDVAAALDADARIARRFPYRYLVPDPGPLGVGVMSAFPIIERSAFDMPTGLVVTLDIGSGRRLRVLDSHPLPGRIEVAAAMRLPVAFDGRDRDAAIGRLRTRIDTLLADAEPLIVMGDFNTAPTDPEYARLTAGLQDVHVAVGIGPGWTWRPNRLEPLGIGLLRIDLVLVGPGVEPVATGIDCSHVGDHCMVDATLAVP